MLIHIHAYKRPSLLEQTNKAELWFYNKRRQIHQARSKHRWIQRYLQTKTRQRTGGVANQTQWPSVSHDRVSLSKKAVLI